MGLDSSSMHLSIDSSSFTTGFPWSLFEASLVCHPVHSLEISAV
jgi:hypothetical protein